ncbi:hypothetical protein A1O3_04979 [Capronia epimyces CBS 606.96]|uniref:Uncharacterized protein n=1 Tax=Capronia epimyces CBS 606.96 TaxID=1182542 RepID=W9XUS8_9EURO|nr:uncharacterized protein A1O3_04979 [Capronia epimyces CBS 606.96]EXJ84312.1 hypothetical protein A1O3_04979 [Capronia epimyces CBS 606.96]
MLGSLAWGNHEVAKRERRHRNANKGIILPYLRLATDFFALHLVKECIASLRPRTQQDTQASHADDHTGRPSICTLRLPCPGSCMVSSQDVDAFRGLKLIVRTPSGRLDLLTASMDTCADGGNAIAKTTAESYGFEPVDGSIKSEMSVAGRQKVRSLGTVVIPFQLPCETQMRDTEFHVFEDLAGHRAILSVSLTMQLGHLRRKPCSECEEAED